MTMASTERNFMPLPRQLFGRTLGEILAELVREKYQRDATKRIARAWDVAHPTAENVTKGKAGAAAILAAWLAEGWPLILAMGEAVTGETYAQFEERRLQAIINEAANAHDTLVQLRARREALESSAPHLDPARAWRSGHERGDVRG